MKSVSVEVISAGRGQTLGDIPRAPDSSECQLQSWSRRDSGPKKDYWFPGGQLTSTRQREAGHLHKLRAGHMLPWPHQPLLLGSTAHRGVHKAVPLPAGCFPLTTRSGGDGRQVRGRGARDSPRGLLPTGIPKFLRSFSCFPLSFPPGGFHSRVFRLEQTTQTTGSSCPGRC